MHLNSHRLGRIGDLIGSHVIIESDQEHLAGAVTKRQTAARQGVIGPLKRIITQLISAQPRLRGFG